MVDRENNLKKIKIDLWTQTKCNKINSKKTSSSLAQGKYKLQHYAHKKTQKNSWDLLEVVKVQWDTRTIMCMQNFIKSSAAVHELSMVH